MSRQGKKAKTNVDFKKLIPAIIVLIAIVVIVILVVKVVNKKGDDISLDSSTSGLIEKAEMINKAEAEYDGNPYNVPESFTTKEETYGGENSASLSEQEVENAKAVISSSFKAYTADQLGIVINMDAVRLIFNTGTTIIADTTCLVFNVYEEVDDSLKYICKFAMSVDGTTLYRFDDEVFVYRMIGQ